MIASETIVTEIVCIENNLYCKSTHRGFLLITSKRANLAVLIHFVPAITRDRWATSTLKDCFLHPSTRDSISALGHATWEQLAGGPMRLINRRQGVSKYDRSARSNHSPDFMKRFDSQWCPLHNDYIDALIRQWNSLRTTRNEVGDRQSTLRTKRSHTTRIQIPRFTVAPFATYIENYTVH